MSAPSSVSTWKSARSQKVKYPNGHTGSVMAKPQGLYIKLYHIDTQGICMDNVKNGGKCPSNPEQCPPDLALDRYLGCKVCRDCPKPEIRKIQELMDRVYAKGEAEKQ